jgi:hypothetical protein
VAAEERGFWECRFQIAGVLNVEQNTTFRILEFTSRFEPFRNPQSTIRNSDS